MGSPLSNLQTLYSATDTGSPPPPPPQSSPKAHQHFLKHPSMCVQWCAVVSDTFYRPQPTPQMPTWFQTDTQASSPTPAAPINTGVLSGSAHTMLYCLPFLQPKSVFISYSQSLSSFPTAKVCCHFLQPKFSEVALHNAACGLKGEDETKPSIYFHPVVQYLSVDTNFLFNLTCTVVPR